VNKTAVSAAQLAKCILLHASACTTVAPSCARTTSKNNSNFGYKLRTVKAENPLKVKNSEPQLRI